jgi:S-DNA-T family DNA segregation ATPase FtsK/SpoIIIE
MDINKLIEQEAAAINRTLQANGIRARASARTAINVEVGFIRYPLKMHPGEKFARVEGIIRELSGVLATGRQRRGLYGPLPIVPVANAGLALEVPHPAPAPLLWSPRSTLETPAHAMLIGRSYLEKPRREHVRFEDSPHVLIAGITGAGKSVLLQTMLLSLCAGTSPTDLRLVLVDLKNEDLVPFERLPHVLAFAGTRTEAGEAIERVVAEKDRRIAQRGYRPFRLVLVIDELAQLANDGEIKTMLGDLASIGRSKAINLIGATQHPTDKGGLGTLLKANFSIRLVGMVAPGQSYIATGRPQTHADLLPGKGAFLRCQGPDVYRFQSFYIEPGEVDGLAKYISQQWAATGSYEVALAPAIASYEPTIAAHRTSDAETRVASYGVMFPLSEGRALSEQEAAAVRDLADRGEFNYRGNFSMNRAMMYVYGSRNPERAAWIDAALNGGGEDRKIIKLRRSA